jgi:SNF2 family DNA or RNA helicase
MIITHAGSNLELRFGYNPDMVQAVKALPDGRRYDAKRKLWVAPITIDNVKFIINELRYDDPMLRGILAGIEKPLARTNGRKVNWKTTPFKHQEDGLELCLSNDAKALFFEQGLGKSLIGIKEIEYRIAAGLAGLDGGIKDALIVAPKTVLVAWKIEWEKYSTIKPTVIGGAKRNELLRSATVALINYDLLLAMKKEIMEKNFGMIVFDESQMVKNHTAQRSKVAYDIAKPIKYRLLLTGTPIGNSAADVFSQFKILDESIFGSSFYCFRAKYFRDMGHGFPDWKVIPSMMPDIKAKMALRSLRLRKEDALDLPEKLYTIQTVDATPEQARIYRDIEKELFTEITAGDGSVQEIAFHYLLVKFMKLNQICSGFLKHEEGQVEIQHEKLSALKQMVNDYPGKVVIFTVFIHDIEAIMDAFPGQAVKVDGSCSTDERTEAINDFQLGDKKIIVLQEQAGSLGITLTAAHLCVFYSRSYSFLNREQAESRLHRIGQKNPVTYVDLIVKGTIEEVIHEAVEEKRLTAGFLQGDFEDLIVERFKKQFAGKIKEGS